MYIILKSYYFFISKDVKMRVKNLYINYNFLKYNWQV